MVMKTFAIPTALIHGVMAKTKIVETILRVNVTPTRESATIYKRQSISNDVQDCGNQYLLPRCTHP